jgi:hypothetical protein
MFAKLRDGDPEQAARFWTPGRLTGMPTEAIVDRLQSMGVDGQRTTFVARAATGTSAWALGDAWRSELPPAGVDRFAEDFLGLAACELWKRYLPTRPSTEMLDDWMQEGYGLEAQGRFEEACDRWQAVWDVLRGRFAPAMRTCGAAEIVFDGTQMLGNWVQDVSMALQNVADEPRYAKLGVRFCEDVLRQFRDEDALFTANLRMDCVEFLFLAGRADDGELALRDVIRDYPDEAEASGLTERIGELRCKLK